jgi:hypothetical protein
MTGDRVANLVWHDIAVQHGQKQLERPLCLRSFGASFDAAAVHDFINGHFPQA